MLIEKQWWSIMKKTNNKEVYVCVLSTNNYLEGVLLLAENLRKLNSKYDLVCLINETITEESKKLLEHFNIEYKLMPLVEYDNFNDDNPYWRYTFDKINLFKLMEYDKIVYLDSDFLILENLDNLFKCKPLSMPRDIPFHPDRFCSCVMVIKPNMKDYEELIKIAKRRNNEKDEISDQDVINEYFKDVNELSSQYNAVRRLTNYQSENYIPLYNYIAYCNGVVPLADVKDPKIVHYIGKIKPFMAENDFIDEYKYQYYYYLDIVRKKEMEFRLFNSQLISVIVPLYNKEKYIDKCLKSIINQTYSNLEIIIVDDKSTDKSLDICKNYAKKDKRIKIIENNKNEGVSHARNVGISNAHGEYISFVDADDTIEPTMIELLHYNAIVYQAEISQCSINLNGKPKLRTEEYEVLFGFPRVLTEFFNDRISSVVFDKLINRHLFDDGTLKFREDYRKNEDLFFVIQLLERSTRTVSTCKCLYNYEYKKKDSLTGNFDYKIDRNLMEIIKYASDLVNYNYDYMEDIHIYYYSKIGSYIYFFENILNNDVDKELLKDDPEFLYFLSDSVNNCERIRRDYPGLSDKCNYLFSLYDKIVEKINS